MIWVLVSVCGLAVETAVIIALGRHVTRRYEAEEPADPGWPSAPRAALAPDPAAPPQAA
jgi:hypothetical protein